MNVIFVVGWKASDKGPQPQALYCGLVGVDAVKAATEAAEKGGLVEIVKFTNPSGTPLPVDPRKTIVSGVPKKVERKPVTVVIPEANVPEPEQALIKQREARFRSPKPPTSVKPATPEAEQTGTDKTESK